MHKSDELVGFCRMWCSLLSLLGRNLYLNVCGIGWPLIFQICFHEHNYFFCELLRVCLLINNEFIWQGAGWKIVASFEGNFPNRIKQLPIDRHFDINNVKRVSFELLLCRYGPFVSWYLQFFGVITSTDPFLQMSDCFGGWWLSTISYFPWKGFEISY